MAQVSVIMNQMMESPTVRQQFTNALGNRTNKFISALVALISADQNLTATFQENPASVLQVALKAANYNLPIGSELGLAYILPYRINGKMTAQFVLGYKGIIQLVKRAGMCTKIGASDVREGEIVKIDRLYGIHEFNWIQNSVERAKLPIIGYVAALQEKNGFEKMEYMTIEEMQAYEQQNRRGQYQSSSWKNYFDAMAKKTVLRKLLRTYGNMDIDTDEVAQDILNQPESEDDDNLPQDEIVEVANENK